MKYGKRVRGVKGFSKR